MSVLGDFETALIAFIQATFTPSGGGKVLKTVESFPSEMGDRLIERFGAHTPGVYVAFGGFHPRQQHGHGDMVTQWTVTAVTGQAREHQRRHGKGGEIGAYEICERLTAVLQGKSIAWADGESDSIAIVRLLSVQAEALARKGLTVYTLDIDVPLTFDPATDEVALDDFVTFRGQWDVQPFEADPQVPLADPDAEDLVPLEQDP